MAEETIHSAPDTAKCPDSAYGSPDLSEYESAPGSYYGPDSSSSASSSSSGPSSSTASTCRPSSCGGSVNFLLLADPSTAEYMPLRKTVSAAVAWHAELCLDVTDLPALLSRGLFWTVRDIDPTKNYFSSTPQEPARPRGPACLGFPHFRHYELVDGTGDGDGEEGSMPLWRGTLRVHARTVRTLREFRPGRLTLDNVRFAAAKDRQGRWVYRFDSENNDACFSAITDDAPLLGWWPWPKAKGSRGAMSKNDAEGVGKGADDVETVVDGGALHDRRVRIVGGNM
ncbi:hypothetical protein ISF_06729 [Cordyceps fumosorosea ARSEF 2679]|uniref:Uncharacterized protein n=1 Tax=Cordyceps fumosorosea (strain ARSEF 2679) TaxID=1081104 RepID=A0A167R1T5_CORFA|nr:hypothetical protein ISF_06729 [Cordyceps fumosorosea ARSEF 2679]OAA58190.1 hypothetical protein ISF_06729 [Cordyceps fumosorosea ARSEF 2679]